jgi:hypothetical protein
MRSEKDVGVNALIEFATIRQDRYAADIEFL